MSGRRGQVLARVRRVVVKVGSSLLRDDPGLRVAQLASDAATLRGRGIEVVVVSSGAIALGMKVLALESRPVELPRLQAVAAVGQGRLMQLYEWAFSLHGLHVAQVLLTHDDLGSRGRYLSARTALREMLRLGAVPVVNENDTVAVDEIKFGDNDRLAALVASLAEADVLCILTDVEGLCDAPPERGGKLITEIVDIDAEATPLAGGAGTEVGTGGMASKVQAAKMAGRVGVPTVVMSGRRPGALLEALDAREVGTIFVPSPGRLASRKHWIAYALKPAGTLVVDTGARKALVDDKRSLLASGVREVRGDFAAGDAVGIATEDGVEFARGLVVYGARDLGRIAGKRTAEIEGVLGYKLLDEVVHRDDLVIL